MKIIYQDDSVKIEHVDHGSYVLQTKTRTLLLNGKAVDDEQGNQVFRFIEKMENWWDLKLFLGKEVRIGTCKSEQGEKAVSVKGIATQSVFLGGVEVLVRNKEGSVKNGSMCDINNLEHLGLMFVLVVARENMD